MTPDVGSLLAFLAPLAVLSLGGYARLCADLKRRGGAVQVDHLGVPEFMLTCALCILLIFAGIRSFFVPAEEELALSPRLIWLNVLFEVFLVACVCAFLKFRKITLHKIIGWRRQTPLRTIGYPILFITLAYPLVAAAAIGLKLFLPEEKEQLMITYARDQVREGHLSIAAVIFVSAALVAPVVEEFFFRGYFYPSIKRYFGPIPAAILVSSIFALVHTNVSTLGPLFCLALCFTLAYEWTGSLLVPIGMHFLFNTVNLLGVFFAEGTLRS